MSEPFISIIITTYNRSFFLKQCLKSIQTALSVRNEEETVEIIVLNNGCTDDTQEQLKMFEQILPLKVLHIKDNILFAGGLLKCMTHARGKYCWILGDDDYIAGDVWPLVDYLKETDADITLINHFFYIRDNRNPAFLMKESRLFLMTHPQKSYIHYSDYLAHANHPNAFFTHIAPVIFKREMWNRFFSQSISEQYKHSQSIHTFIFLSILKQAQIIGYFDQQLLAVRVGSSPDEWMTEEGRLNRIRMDVEYFTDMVRDVFDEKNIIKHFKGVMLKKSVSVLLFGSKIRCNFPFPFYIRVFKLLYHHYKTYPFFWYAVVPVLLAPRKAFLLLYKLFLWKPKFGREK
jgi:glycosyltransferase involved in cell wall biosynthesis